MTFIKYRRITEEEKSELGLWNSYGYFYAEFSEEGEVTFYYETWGEGGGDRSGGPLLSTTLDKMHPRKFGSVEYGSKYNKSAWQDRPTRNDGKPDFTGRMMAYQVQYNDEYWASSTGVPSRLKKEYSDSKTYLKSVS